MNYALAAQPSSTKRKTYKRGLIIPWSLVRAQHALPIPGLPSRFVALSFAGRPSGRWRRRILVPYSGASDRGQTRRGGRSAMGILSKLFGRPDSGTTQQRKASPRAAAARPPVSSIPPANLQRELLRLALRQSLSRNGIPVHWIGAEAIELPGPGNPLHV